MKAIDVSFGRISPAWAHARLSEGWDLLVQCAWTGGYENIADIVRVCEPNLRDFREAGGKTAIYTNVAPWRTPQVWFDETVKNAGRELRNVIGILIDHEIHDPKNNPPVATDTQIAEFITLLRGLGKPLGIYSADWYVSGQMRPLGRKTDWGLPYWVADYDGDARLTPARVKHPLGPVKAKQYTNTTNVGGIDVDLSVFDDDFFGTQQEDSDMAARTLVKMQGHIQVYEVVAGRLVHVPSWEAVAPATAADVKEYPANHVLWTLPAEYRSIPKQLGGPADVGP